MKLSAKKNQTVYFTQSGMSKTANATIKNRAENDFYVTNPIAIDCLVSEIELDNNIWECACGAGHLSERLADLGFSVYSTDICDYGYGDDFFDFLTCNQIFPGDIVTNPPFKYFLQFVKKGLSLVEPNHKVAMLGRIQALESESRVAFYKEFPPKYILVFAKRLQCVAYGKPFESGGMQCYAWYVFEKGYKGITELRWVNTK